MRIVMASDHGGLELRRMVLEHARERGYEVVDLGTHEDASVDYPDYAVMAVEKMRSGEADRAVLVCGTGLGISMAANRHKGVRAALCHNEFEARMSRQHNDANVLVLGGRAIGPGLAASIFDAWMSAEFEGGRHANRVEKIESIEG
ncbi:ribose 5-phosphate isomerase [Thiohalorhabdus denitrificans]|uniref:Ribose-5-phosphate isomerase n=1 Tax=Thiohalorhabdus denitrificans TaxID=381306 RepID=A0A0P9EDZ2_9GAMM|nr:ribose 5-phosphate isomerase B [Thiohalorhabdus denitrificans]KPV40580.1 ribose 5-phosphate isomerase [Thiohalorhabdus denitrificans]SCY50587.1 ribose-5-phosphate isomerase [Thiohalorhabdus denitrificans]